MKKDRFWQQMQAEYPNQFFFKSLWDKFALKLWLCDSKNRKFMEEIPDIGECFSFVRNKKIKNCICGKCF